MRDKPRRTKWIRGEVVDLISKSGPPLLVTGNSELFTCDVLKRDQKAA